MDFTGAFMWLCLALFGATAIVWLLDMIGVLTIRSAAQRKMLNASLGVTLIGGMASFAVNTFFRPPGPDLDHAPGANRAFMAVADPLPEASGTPSPGPADPAPGPPATVVDTELSEPVRAFLAANRLSRPVIDPQWNQRYPACARQARATTLPAPDARRCFRELDQFNALVLKPYQDAYEGYVPRVAELSFGQSAGEVLDFLRAEASGFTNGTNAIAQLYRTISKDLDADFALLRQQAYR